MKNVDYDTVIKTLQGKITRQPIISLWRHYPDVDWDIPQLIRKSIEDQNNYPSDLIKLSPHGRYCVVDFGCEIIQGTSKMGENGSSSCSKCIIQDASDWEKQLEKFDEIDPLDGHYGKQIQYVKEMSKEFPNRPIMQTVFCPTMVAAKISNNQFLNHYKSESKKLVGEGFQIISRITKEYASACLDAGSNGIFVALQDADVNRFSFDDRNFLISLNQSFMSRINIQAEFSVLHLHGNDVDFSHALNKLRPTAVNWHDQTSVISLEKGASIFSGGLLGGLDPDTIIDSISIEHLILLKEKINSLPLILAPGCVILQGTKDNSLDLIFKLYKKID